MQEELLLALRIHIRVALQQQTADVKVAITRTKMQWSPSTRNSEEKEMISIEVRFDS
jgi:hypothetical protein